MPEGEQWSYELKFDGYRSLGIKTSGTVSLRSRNDKDFSRKYPVVPAALRSLPNDTVVDGETVALYTEGRPRFNLLQNVRSSSQPVLFFLFDVLILSGRDPILEQLVSDRLKVFHL